MNQEFLQSLTPKQVLQFTGSVIDELIRRGINRTGNNPRSDYTECLVAKKYGLNLAPPSEQVMTWKTPLLVEDTRSKADGCPNETSRDS